MRVNLVNVLSQEGRTEQLDVELTMESFDSGLEQFSIASRYCRLRLRVRCLSGFHAGAVWNRSK